jgi:hypothetical protein
MNPESRSQLPGIAFGDFAKRFREPTLEEGLPGKRFQDVIRVDFAFEGTPAQREVWERFWI